MLVYKTALAAFVEKAPHAGVFLPASFHTHSL